MLLFVLLIASTGSVVSSVNFLFFGDWGYAGTNQSLIASQMGEWAGENKAKFVVSLGDNFYKRGVQNDTDPLWTNLYTNVYTSPSLQIPWYVILGNHDYFQNAQAQIDYYKNKRDTRWTMPDHVYNVIYPVDSFYPGAPSSSTLEIIFIDTSIVAPTLFGEDITPQQHDDSLKKIEKLLSQSTATWLFVAGHYTIYSTAEHGNTKELIASLVPLLKKYKVHAYLNGHDHLLQHLLVDGIHYITSGRGTCTDNYPANEGEHPINGNNEELLYRSLAIGFNSVTVSSDSVTIRFHNGAKGGTADYSFQLLVPRSYVASEANNGAMAAHERHKHLLRLLVVGVFCLTVGTMIGMFAPTSWRVTLSKWCCGGQFKFCDRKLSGDSLNTMVPTTEAIEGSSTKSNGDSSTSGTVSLSQRVVRLFTGVGSGGGVYDRVNSSDGGSVELA